MVRWPRSESTRKVILEDIGRRQHTDAELRPASMLMRCQIPSRPWMLFCPCKWVLRRKERRLWWPTPEVQCSFQDPYRYPLHHIAGTTGRRRGRPLLSTDGIVRFESPSPSEPHRCRGHGSSCVSRRIRLSSSREQTQHLLGRTRTQ